MIMLKDYYNYLQTLDWFAAYSDDGAVVRRGEERLRIALEMAQDRGPEFVALFEAYRDHKWKGSPAPMVPA
jgi:hypothetical protein